MQLCWVEFVPTTHVVGFLLILLIPQVCRCTLRRGFWLLNSGFFSNSHGARGWVRSVSTCFHNDLLCISRFEPIWLRPSRGTASIRTFLRKSIQPAALFLESLRFLWGLDKWFLAFLVFTFCLRFFGERAPTYWKSAGRLTTESCIYEAGVTSVRPN